MGDTASLQQVSAMETTPSPSTLQNLLSCLLDLALGDWVEHGHGVPLACVRSALQKSSRHTWR